MGRRHIVKILDVPPGGIIPALVVLSAAFLLGGVVGCALAASVGGGGSESLTAYIQEYWAAVQAGLTEPPALLSVVWETVRWPGLAVLLGFTALGFVGIPVLFVVRGFLMSFTISSFIRMFGVAGGGMAFLLFGVTGLFALPTLFVLGVQGLSACYTLACQAVGDGKRGCPYTGAYFLRCGLCAGVLAFCIVIEMAVVPTLLSALSGLFVSSASYIR
jgi:hypothetical protein